MTAATFADVRQLAQAILNEPGAQGDVRLEREGCRTTLAAKVDLDGAADLGPDSHVRELLSDLWSYTFALTEGRFVAADGFELAEDGAIAVPDRKKTATDGVLTLSLTWARESCAADPPRL